MSLSNSESILIFSDITIYIQLNFNNYIERLFSYHFHLQTCYEKEAVLHLEQNQVINLTAKYPYRELSGCYYTPYYQTTPSKKYTHSIPTLPYRTQTTNFLPAAATSATYATEDTSYNEDAASSTVSNNYEFNTEQTEITSVDTILDFNYTESESAEEAFTTVS